MGEEVKGEKGGGEDGGGNRREERGRGEGEETIGGGDR